MKSNVTMSFSSALEMRKPGFSINGAASPYPIRTFSNNGIHSSSQTDHVVTQIKQLPFAQKKLATVWARKSFCSTDTGVTDVKDSFPVRGVLPSNNARY